MSESHVRTQKSSLWKGSLEGKKLGPLTDECKLKYRFHYLALVILCSVKNTLKKQKRRFQLRTKVKSYLTKQKRRFQLSSNIGQLKGKKLSDETRAKMSEAHKKRYAR
jgi:hypothetical protein